MPKTVLLTTTIRLPTFIEEVGENIVRHKHTDILWYIIGDRKTPPKTEEYCRVQSEKFGLPIIYVDLEAQAKTLADFPELLKMVPENTPVRRLLWHLVAYLEGAEVLISVDDDNFVTDIDFVGSHQIVGTSSELKLIKTDTGWHNVYEALQEEKNIPIFPRGYPWGQRNHPPKEKIIEKRALPVIANNGFVLEDPDLDAVSRLFWPIRILDMSSAFKPNFGLSPGTWSSFNNQNTAFSREVIPVYYTPVSTGRNADIWASYVICRLAEHLGGVISYGYPLVRQVRNPHNLWQDLKDEMIIDQTSDSFVALLRSVPLSAKTYLEALGELLEGSLERLASIDDVPAEGLDPVRSKSPQATAAPLVRASNGVDMMRSFFIEYQVWHKTFLQAVK